MTYCENIGHYRTFFKFIGFIGFIGQLGPLDHLQPNSLNICEQSTVITGTQVPRRPGIPTNLNT